MHVTSLALAIASLGVNFGWQPSEDAAPGYEYVVQIEPAHLQMIAQGKAPPIESHVPAHVAPIRQVRIIVGNDELPCKDHSQPIERTAYRQPTGDWSSSGSANPPQRYDHYGTAVPQRGNGTAIPQGSGPSAPSGPLGTMGTVANELVEDTREQFHAAGQALRDAAGRIANDGRQDPTTTQAGSTQAGSAQADISGPTNTAAERGRNQPVGQMSGTDAGVPSQSGGPLSAQRPGDHSTTNTPSRPLNDPGQNPFGRRWAGTGGQSTGNPTDAADDGPSLIRENHIRENRTNATTNSDPSQSVVAGSANENNEAGRYANQFSNQGDQYRNQEQFGNQNDQYSSQDNHYSNQVDQNSHRQGQNSDLRSPFDSDMVPVTSARNQGDADQGAGNPAHSQMNFPQSNASGNRQADWSASANTSPPSNSSTPPANTGMGGMNAWTHGNMSGGDSQFPFNAPGQYASGANTSPANTAPVTGPGQVNQQSPVGAAQQTAFGQHASIPGSQQTVPKEKPWIPLIMVGLGLIGSLGVNLFLGFSYLDARHKYLSAVRRSSRPSNLE